MIENKRFIPVYECVTQDNEVYVVCKGEHNADVVATALNELYERNEYLEKENTQLKQDNNALIHLLENQSIIIQELHSKLLEYQVKEPIVLTKEDLKIMGKAIDYYSRG